MEILNTQTNDAKKVWETPTLIEISKNEILGAGAAAGDGGALLT